MSLTANKPSGGHGNTEEKVNLKAIPEILKRHAGERGSLIPILEDIQTVYGYLPEEALKLVVSETGRSATDVYGVATFYRAFSLTPRGRHLVCVCLGTACHVRGASAIAEELKLQLGISDGETTADKEFTLETVNCLGACALGPVVVIDGHYFSKVRKSRIRQMLEDARSGCINSSATDSSSMFPVTVNCPVCKGGLMDENFTLDSLPAIQLSISSAGVSGRLRLSSLYGSPECAVEYDVPAGSAVEVSCPHCKAALSGALSCSSCAAPMASLDVQGGAVLHFCSRRGCHNRSLDLTPSSCLPEGGGAK